jgi:hypothetical protein
VKRRYALSLAGLVACRFGGPSANPDQYVAFADATADRAPALMTTTPGDDGGSTMPVDDAAEAPPDAGLDDATEGGCSSTVAVCDPVHNTGCNPLQQCDVNPLQTNMPTGQCVLGGSMDAGLCIASIFTESCAPGSTCVDGGCRQLCFCNADCAPGQCCSDTSGPPGFTLCRPCP